MKLFWSGVLAFSIVAGSFGAKPESYPEHLSADRGGQIIKDSIQALGGWDNWKAKRNVQYERDSTHYESDGQIIHEVQFHKLTLPPEVKIRQESLRDGKRVVTAFDGLNAWVIEDGVPQTEAKRLSGARNSSFGTQYMFCVPFKLADPGTIHEYVGPVRLSGGTFDQVRVTYKPGTGDNPTHVWTFYFNQKTHFMERLDWSNAENTSHSISEYSDFRKISGLWWPMRRVNYERQPNGGKGRKISALIYTNIRFNNDFGAGTFTKPVSKDARH